MNCRRNPRTGLTASGSISFQSWNDWATQAGHSMTETPSLRMVMT